MPPRHLQPRLQNALTDTPVVWVAGAPRSGKTRLLQGLQAELPDSCLIPCAEPAHRAHILGDPAGFLAELPGLACLDDVDQVPALWPLVRAAVDRGQRFLLSSTRVWPGAERELARRLERFTLWPLAQAECQGFVPGFIDACFQGLPERLRYPGLARPALLGRVLAGGYPEVVDLDPGQRERWFQGYLGGLLQGDFSTLTELRELRPLLRLLREPGRDPDRAKRCLELLQQAHLLVALPEGGPAPWRCFNDSGLQAQILGLGGAVLERPSLAAPLLETFAVMELVKSAPWSRARPSLRSLRIGGQRLLLLEDHRQEVVAVAVNAEATVPAAAFQGLRALQALVGARWRAGVVLTTGDPGRNPGPGLWALPFQALWAPSGERPSPLSSLVSV